MEEAPNNIEKIFNLRIHIMTGLVVAALSIIRIIQFSSFGKRKMIPAPLDSGSKFSNALKSMVHLVLRNMLIGLSITGVLTMWLGGYISVALSGDPSDYENTQQTEVFTAHAVLSKVYLLLFIVHIIGIIRYGIVKRQNSLSRMI